MWELFLCLSFKLLPVRQLDCVSRPGMGDIRQNTSQVRELHKKIRFGEEGKIEGEYGSVS